jgi:hypothetical protein
MKIIDKLICVILGALLWIIITGIGPLDVDVVEEE